MRDYHDTFPEMEYTLADEMVVEDIDNEIIEEVETEEEPLEQSEGEAEEDTEDDEVVISIGGETPTQEDEEQTKAPPWVRDLRKNYRELQRENRELKQKTQQVETPQRIELGKKPTLEESDWDEEVFEKSLGAWYERKRKADEVEMQSKQQVEAQQKEWQNTLTSYETAKESLKVRDYDFAEDVVSETLSQAQQGIILQGTDNPAIVVYALGKNPKKAKELAAITDPVKFAFAVAKLEGTLKVTNRKAPPPPEKVVSGTGKMSGTVDSTLERLRNEAEKTGDYTKVAAYKKQKRSN